MKTNLRLFVFALLLILCLTACDRGGDVVPGRLRLVPLNVYDLEKAVVDEQGKMWLPAQKLQSVLAKPASADINFNEVKATKTLQYVLMNVGNTDVFDILFEAENIVIYPMSITTIPAAGEGGDISMLPIVSFTREHVIPIDGVGSLLDMTVGEFSDLLSLSYNYTLQDTAGAQEFDVVDEYGVSGTTMGAIIDIFVNGRNVKDAVIYGITGEANITGISESALEINLWNGDFDTVIVENSGNAPLPMQIFNQQFWQWWINSPALDTIVPPGGQIDVSGILRGTYYMDDQETAKGDIILFGLRRNQSYIFQFYDRLYIDGYRYLVFAEHPVTN